MQTPGEPAVEQLFDLHYDRLVRSLTIVAGDRETARDAVQEAFVEAHLRWRRIGGYDDPVGWIRRVAFHRVLNDRRSLRRRLAALVRLGAGDHATDDTESVELRPSLAAALDRLSDRQRAAVALHHVEGLSIESTAAVMGIAPSTVTTHLARGRDALRDHMEVS